MSFGDASRAENYVTTGLERGAPYGRLAFQKGLLKLLRGAVDDAVVEFEKSVYIIWPDDALGQAHAYEVWAEVLLRTGKPEASLSVATVGLSIHPSARALRGVHDRAAAAVQMGQGGSSHHGIPSTQPVNTGMSGWQ